jgi:hypothetical protein
VPFPYHATPSRRPVAIIDRRTIPVGASLRASLAGDETAIRDAVFAEVGGRRAESRSGLATAARDVPLCPRTVDTISANRLRFS